MKAFFSTLAAACLAVSAAEYGAEQLKLVGAAAVNDGVLVLDGKGYAAIPGTESVNIAAPGATFACSVNPKFDVQKKESEKLDSYFSKDRTPFTICRWAPQISSRVFNNRTQKYVIERCDFQPKAGVWTHLAFVFEPAPEKTDVWIMRFFVNGKLKHEKTVENLSPAIGRGPVEVGKGWGGPWTFTGKMADFSVAQKVLTSDEIAVLFAKSRAARK